MLNPTDRLYILQHLKEPLRGDSLTICFLRPPPTHMTSEPLKPVISKALPRKWLLSFLDLPHEFLQAFGVWVFRVSGLGSGI